MKITGCVIAFSAAVAVATAPALAETKLLVPAGSTITVQGAQTPQMNNAVLMTEGDAVDLVTMKPLVVNGYIAIAAGTHVHAHVVKVTKMGVRQGFLGVKVSNPALFIACDYVQLPQGKVRLDGATQEVKGKLPSALNGKHTDNSMVPMILPTTILQTSVADSVHLPSLGKYNAAQDTYIKG